MTSESERSSWEFEEGDEIAPGLFALKSLGGGSHYEAYLVWAERLAYMLVAKVLRPALIGDRHAVDALRREAEIVGQLDHPIIVRSYGSEIDGEHPYLLLEFLEGPNLSSLIRRGTLQMEQLLPLGMNLCAAAHYLAIEGVVHLDIKPANVIMGVPPRLIDLSVARSVVKAKKITGHVGTDEYMAPEQCDPGAVPIGSPADIWGVGATLYRAATGRFPFPQAPDADESDLHARFPQISGTPDPMGDSVPGAFQVAVLACLRRDPSERPHASELAEMLEPMVGALPRKPLLRRARPGLGRRLAKTPPE